ncbi:UNVERIFIED_CONTAM: hypothetical protein FKN15_001247 [Acipenser sinensis]
MAHKKCLPVKLPGKQVAAAFQQYDSLRGWLMGDNGYQQKQWLLTLLLNPTNPAEAFRTSEHLLEQWNPACLRTCHQCQKDEGAQIPQNIMTQLPCKFVTSSSFTQRNAFRKHLVCKIVAERLF